MDRYCIKIFLVKGYNQATELHCRFQEKGDWLHLVCSVNLFFKTYLVG